MHGGTLPAACIIAVFSVRWLVRVTSWLFIPACSWPESSAFFSSSASGMAKSLDPRREHAGMTKRLSATFVLTTRQIGMKPFLILSHGLESGPDATKVSALAASAERLGFRSVRPDYRDLDAGRDVNKIDARIERLIANAPSGQRVILAGSSMGAFASAHASVHMPLCVGLFLIALPVAIPGYPRPFAAALVPTALVHGWNDEICPVDAAVTFARERNASITLVDDDHRLGAHVDFSAAQFRIFLEQFT
jgi:predicted alpha/beta-hydrolase family hydrolase